MLNFVFGFCFQYLVTENHYVKVGIKKCLRCLRPKTSGSKYKVLEKTLNESDWPDIGQKFFPLPTAIDMSEVPENIPLSEALSR